MKISKLSRHILISILCVLVGLGNTFAEGESFWHGFKGDGRHSGFVNQKMSNKLALQWRYFFKGDFLFPLQLYGEDIYFLDRTGSVNSIQRADATENYTVNVNQGRDKVGPEEEGRFVFGIDVCEKYIFVTLGPLFTKKKIDLSCFLVALDRKTGKKEWEQKFDCFLATPPVVFGSHVYVATGKIDATFSRTTGGDLYCYDIDSQEETFRIQLEDYAFYGEYLTHADNVLITHVMKYDANADVELQPKMVAFDASTGKELWSEPPMEEDRIFGLPSIKEGALYVMENPFFIFGGGKGATPDAWFLKFDLKTGKLLNKMIIQKENFGNFAPTLAQDAIYINSFTGSIYSIDYAMDRVYWKKDYDRFSYFTELTSTRNYLYTCLFNGEFLCISKEDGSVVYRYRVGNYGGIPVVSGDEIFVSGENLYCFSVNAKPTLIVEPPSMTFEPTKQGKIIQKSFRVLYTGIEKLSGKLSSSVPWLSVKPGTINGNIQTCFATIDTSQMESGQQMGMILVDTNFGTKSIPVRIEVMVPPPLPLSWNIKEGHITNQKNFLVLGQSDPLTRILLNSYELFADDQGRFGQVILLKEGRNPIQAEAISKDGRKSSLSGQIILDTIPPALEVSMAVRDEKDPFTGLISGKTEPGAVITILDQDYTPSSDGSFSLTIQIELELTEITIMAQDPAGNKTRIKRKV